MKRVLAGILMIFCLVPSLLEAAAKNNGPFISLHPEGSSDEGQRMVRPDETGGVRRYYRISPEVSGRHFGGYTAFMAEDGASFGAVLYLNEEGGRAMQVLCSTFNGKLARIIVNGRPVDTVRIDRAPTDGKVVIWSGLSKEDFKAFDKSKKLKRIGGEDPNPPN